MTLVAPDAAEAMLRDGFAYLDATTSRAWLARSGTLDDWDAFAASWEGMRRDTYMADGGRYRSRRHAIFAASAGGPIRRSAHQPHYQTIAYNRLNGGIPRWFEPMPPALTSGATMRTILTATRALFDGLTPARSWLIELHQFRIEARADEAGQPTPEGLHRDGVDFVLVLLIERTNIEQGTTRIHDFDHHELGSFTLTEPLDAALVDDRRVFHGVTAVRPIDAALPAHRDVLVVTYRGV